MKRLEDPTRDPASEDRDDHAGEPAPVPPGYAEALRMHDEIEAAYLSAVAKHRAACGTTRLPTGLTPDHVKASPEWKITRSKMDRAQRILAEFNRGFLKRYKKEWKRTLEERRTLRTR